MLNVRLGISIILLTVFAFGCKPEEEMIKTNFFILDGVEYQITQAFSEEFGATGSDADLYNFDLIIGSSGFDFTDIENSWIKGSGDVLYFELWTPNETTIEDGSYTHSLTAGPNNYTNSFIGINYNATGMTSDESFENEATGDVTISITGDVYTINFDLILTDNKTLTGNYTGSVPYYLN